MLRPFGPGLPSDAIAHRYGLDGSERGTALLFNADGSCESVPSTFVINTRYPELSGEFYINRALIELIDRAMRSIGIFPVMLDPWREEGLVPIEGEGHLEEREDYVLVQHPNTRVGSLRISPCCENNGPHYKDRLILYFVLPGERTRQLVDEVENRCRAASVRFAREPNAGPKTHRRFLQKLVARMRRCGKHS
jgi:hypothetical protein